MRPLSSHFTPTALASAWCALAFLALGLTACDPPPVETEDPEPEELDATIEGIVTSAENDSIEGATLTASRIDENGSVLETATSAEDGTYELTFTILDNEVPDSLRIETEATGFLTSETTLPFDPALEHNPVLNPVTGEAVAFGQITDSTTTNPISGATITGTGDGGRTWFTVSTDGGGEYETVLSFDAAPDSMTFTAEAEGFGSVERTRALADTMEVNFSTGPGFAGGTGTEADPFRIETAEHLQNTVFFLDAHFIQTDDVDASETATWNDGAGFLPIGTLGGPPFTGRFDGNDHVITGLTVDRPEIDGIGLFGHLGEAEVDDVTLVDAEITGNELVGGLVGRSDNGSVVRGSSVGGDISGERLVGGLIGQVAGTVETSQSNGAITGTARVGGLVGTNTGDIRASRSLADASGDKVRIGGLVGANVDGDISASYAKGDVSADGSAGGLVGRNFGGAIEETYATGAVSASDNDGGLVGANLEEGTLAGSYWDTQTTGQGSATGTGDASDTVVGLSTSEMTGENAPANMPAFSFGDTWQTTDSYPVLYWEE